MPEEKTATNWLAISVIGLLVVAIVLGALAFQSMSKKIGSNELIINEQLEATVPEYSNDHIPCKLCRDALNEGFDSVVATERAQIIVALTRAKTGHSAHDSGMTHAINVIKAR